MPSLNRNLVVAASVVLLHLLALWALQAGLLRRAVAVFVPVEVLSEMVESPRPVAVPPAPVAPAPPVPAVTKPVVARMKLPARSPPPQLLAVATPDPAPNAPTGVTTAPLSPSPITEPVAAAVAESRAPGPPSAPTPARLELPSSDAQYLQNPRPVYPALSKRLQEQGTVLIALFVGVDGTVKKGEVKRSSGFDRLDQSALAAVLKWRFVPGKRAGVPEAMWYDQPITFELK